MIFLKHKYKIIPRHSVVENDEYFYRHPEMLRSNVDEDVFDLNEFNVENMEKNKNNLIKNK